MGFACRFLCGALVCVCISASCTAEDNTGTISGEVTFTGYRTKILIDGKYVHKGSDGLQWVGICIDGEQLGDTEIRNAVFELTPTGFVPRVGFGTVGGELEIRNKQKAPLFIQARGFDLRESEVLKPDESIKATISPKERSIYIETFSGTESATMFTTSSPYFAVTDEHGNFAIAHVPPGKHTLQFRHPCFKSRQFGPRGKVEIVVEAGKTTEVPKIVLTKVE